MINTRKACSLVLVAAMAIFTASCKNAGANSPQKSVNADAGAIEQTAEESAAPAEAVAEVTVNGNTITYGDHSYTVSGEFNNSYKVPTAFVTFTNFPADYTEFEAIYNGLLGKSIQGTAVPSQQSCVAYHGGFAGRERSRPPFRWCNFHDSG